jgi:phage baseplate assembly protein W
LREEFIGSGWAFPIRVNGSGGIALVSSERDLEESIRLILSAAPGERPMRPEFGCAIHDLVFAAFNPDTAGRIARAVRDALMRWEPRIEVHDVSVAPLPGGDPSIVGIDVAYSTGDENDRRNLVFPFYVIPAEE